MLVCGCLVGVNPVLGSGYAGGTVFPSDAASMRANAVPAKLEALANDFGEHAKVPCLAVQPPFLYQT